MQHGMMWAKMGNKLLGLEHSFPSHKHENTMLNFKEFNIAVQNTATGLTGRWL